MVSEIIKKGERYFRCDECLLLFEDEGWAEKCEAWCKEHESCNVEITSHSMKGKSFS